MLDTLIPTDLKDIGEPDDVRVHVSGRLSSGVTDAGLGSEMQDLGRLGVRDDPLKQRAIADVASNKREAVASRLRESRLLECHVIVGVQVVDPDDARSSIEQRAGDVVTDKAGGARDEDPQQQAAG